MECPSCYDIYNDEDKIPRNLPCGHTYCQECLTQIQNIKKRLECPICRIHLDPSIKPSKLSKNYVAADIAGQHRDIQKKLLFCAEHSEPLRFFCENCEKNICASCIIDHSGHKFVKQDHSVPLLKQRVSDMKAKLDSKMSDVKQAKEFSEKWKESIITTKEEQIQKLEDGFDKIISQIVERKNTLKKNYEEACKEELANVDVELTIQEEIIKNIDSNHQKLTDYCSNLDKQQIIQGNQFQDQLNELEKGLNKDIKSIKVYDHQRLTMHQPKVILDPSVMKDLGMIGTTSKNLKYPKICYFGEKNKILMYSIERDEWKLSQIPLGQSYEFQYYSSAATLPNGNILITGGGISNSVCEISLVSNGRHNSPMLDLRLKAPMNQTRKEHASVLLGNCVYVLGGYDGTQNCFLSSCEKYDLETDEWKPVTSMLIAKCAFGTTTVAGRYIFVVGGYDGQERLSSIEKYDSKLDKWMKLDVKLPQPLSNSACFSYLDNAIVILGGGFNVGFCLSVKMLNIETFEWKDLSPMNDGRDLRNKLVSHDGFVYAIGGNNFYAEKYCIKTNDWSPLQPHQELVNDNLDSWACALFYQVSESGNQQSQNEKFKQLQPNRFNSHPYIKPSNAYPNYDYDYDDEEVFSEQSGLFEEWMQNMGSNK